jgi:hypothetical protein
MFAVLTSNSQCQRAKYDILYRWMAWNIKFKTRLADLSSLTVLKPGFYGFRTFHGEVGIVTSDFYTSTTLGVSERLA